MEAPVSIPLALVYPSQNGRSVDESKIPGLAESIKDIGLRHPISVRKAFRVRDGREAEVYEIVAGRHRYEAMLKNGETEIPAYLIEDDLRAKLWEIDENLMRAELSPADRATLVDRRKAIYEKLHPETKHGGDRASRQVGDLKEADRFTAETARATGKSERSVQRDAERGENIDPEALSLIRGTKLDKGVYLDALKKLPKDQQVAKVKADLAVKRPSVPQPSARRQRNALDDKMTKEDANERLAEWLAENSHGEQWATLSALIYAAGYTPLGKAFNRLVGTPVFDSTSASRG